MRYNRIMDKATPSSPPGSRWLLLTHQLPPHPAYRRVKVWRRLQSIGAIAIKRSVYVLPYSDDALEDFLWTAKEIEAGKGEALVCEARMLLGATDGQLRAQFDAAREADYAALVEEGKGAMKLAARRRPSQQDLQSAETVVRRLLKRCAEVTAIDFFGAGGRQTAESLIAELDARVRALTTRPGPLVEARPKPAKQTYDGKTWVTRHGVKIDRVASAWLIRRFIDANARFRFVDPLAYQHAPGELRFDMAAAEFTHRGDRCSFEVLLVEMDIADSALAAIGEIIHDLDLKDNKFCRPETEGVRQLIAGLVLATDDDGERIRQAGALFDNLYRSFREGLPAARARKGS